METFLNHLIDLIILVLDIIIKLQTEFTNYWELLKDDFPIVLDILNYIIENLLVLLRLFNVFFTFRFMLSWFPNINPFIAPYYAVRVATQPYIDFVAKRIPRLFGQDVSFFVCSFMLNYVLENLSRLKF